jgi:predicted nucleic acid-binding Zn ribbon protein
MEGDDQTGMTDAPVVPCAECAKATQAQIVTAAGIGVLMGVGAFYLITRATRGA